jgi:hypothetical protein
MDPGLGEIVVDGDPRARVNLIHVDQVIGDCINLARADFMSSGIYHLTARGGPTVGALSALVSDRLGLPTLCVATRRRQPTQIENWLDLRLRFYAAYLKFHGTFARSLPAGDPVDLDSADRLISGFLTAGPLPERLSSWPTPIGRPSTIDSNRPSLRRIAMRVQS